MSSRRPPFGGRNERREQESRVQAEWHQDERALGISVTVCSDAAFSSPGQDIALFVWPPPVPINPFYVLPHLPILLDSRGILSAVPIHSDCQVSQYSSLHVSGQSRSVVSATITSSTLEEKERTTPPTTLSLYSIL